MNENILALALASLPNALLTDTFFQNLCNNIPLEFKICGKIKIRKSTYLTYKNIEPILSNYFEPLQNKEDLLKLVFSYPNFLLTINITNKNDSYKLELKILNETNIKILTFEKQTNYSKIKIISKKINKGKITSYKNEIHYYDPNYQELTNDDSLNEILKDFSNLFYIPNELALFFYQNFNKYQEELNKSRIKSEIELDNLTRPINEEYAFMEPMTLERIKLAIINSGINIDKRLWHRLEENIPRKQLIVISKNLFESIIKYMMGFTLGVISTTGIILSKEINYYNCYHVYIEGENTKIIKEQIDENKARELFYLSDKNQDKEELKDFFNISKTR